MYMQKILLDIYIYINCSFLEIDPIILKLFPRVLDFLVATKYV